MLKNRLFVFTGTAIAFLISNSALAGPGSRCEDLLRGGFDRGHSERGSSIRSDTSTSQQAITALHAKWRNSIYENYPEPMVRVAYMSLSQLMTKNPVAFYEYVMLCRNSDHKLFGNSGEFLIENTSQMVSLNEGRYKADRHMRELTLALTNDKDLLELALLSPPPKP
jgi:hypothetical protein